MLKDWKAGIVLLSLTLALPMIAAQSVEAKKKSASTKEVTAAAGAKSKGPSISKSKDSAPVADKDDAVRSVLIKFEAAINAHNVDDVTAIFADDTSFIDESGDETRGRSALRERFEQLFKQAKASAIGIHPQTITFPADNVALVVGEVSRKHESADLPASRFSMVLARKENSWQINQITETAMQAVQTENRLQELNWMIGEWTAEKPGATAQFNVEWAPSRKFITSKCTINKNGAAPQVDTQVIGWDPQHNSIVSWHFDSNGGFGGGAWSKQHNENKWTVAVVGVGADGSNSVASNVFTMKTSDEFSWQSINRSLDGAPVADTEAIIVKRAKH